MSPTTHLTTRLGWATALAVGLISPTLVASPASADLFPGDPAGPTTGNDAYLTRIDTELTVKAPGLLANDSHYPGGNATLTTVRGGDPQHGQVVISTDGSFVYQPDAGYQGVDTFYYDVIDGDDQRSRVTPVRITVGDPDLELVAQEKSFRSGDWVDAKADGVVDGNPIRFRAVVTNESDAPNSTLIRIVDEKNDVIPGGTITKTIPAHDKVVVTVPWASTGRAYKADFQPRTEDYHFALKVLPDGDSQTTTKMDLPILPRPIVAVHGYKSNAESSWASAKLQGLERFAHPKAHLWAVGDFQAPGVMNTGSIEGEVNGDHTSTIARNAAQEATYIADVRRQTNAWHVDILAHSMGGLISRFYIQNLMPPSGDGRPVVNRLVQLGTPNEGSSCADLMLSVGAATGKEPPLMPATLELSTDYVKRVFNGDVRDLRGVELTNEAGEAFYMAACGANEFGDGVVPRSSASWNLPESAIYRSGRNHLSMTDNAGDFRRYAMRVLQIRPGSEADWRTTTLSGSRAGAGAAAAPTTSPTPFHVDEVPLAPEETVTRPLQVPVGTHLGVLLTDASVDMSLIDPAGVTRSTYTHDDGLLYGGLDTGEVTPGAWSLRLTNTTQAVLTTAVVATIAGNPIGFGPVTARYLTDGRVVVSAHLDDGAQPITGADLTAQILGLDGVATTIALTEDGLGGYSGATDPLGPDAGRQVSLQAVLPDGTQRYETAPISAAAPGQQIPDHDDAPPVVTSAVTEGTTGTNGWYRSPVTVEIAATDPTRAGAPASGVRTLHTEVDGADGIETLTGRQARTMPHDGHHVVSWTAQDNAGNLSGPGSLPVDIDTIAPSVTVGYPLDGQELTAASSTTALFSCDDATSGVASCQLASGPAHPTTDSSPLDMSPGPHHVEVVGFDIAGNRQTVEVTYTVVAPDPGDPGSPGSPGSPGTPVGEAPRILIQPAAIRTTQPGHVVRVRVTAAGTRLRYQWQRRTRAGWRAVAHGDHRVLELRPLTSGVIRLRVVVRNDAGAVTSRVIHVVVRRR